MSGKTWQASIYSGLFLRTARPSPADQDCSLNFEEPQTEPSRERPLDGDIRTDVADGGIEDDRATDNHMVRVPTETELATKLPPGTSTS